MTDPVATEAKRGLHVPSIGIGVLIGCVVGCIGGSVVTGGSSSGTVSSTASGTAITAPAASAPAAPAAPVLPVTLGRGPQSYGYAQFPVTVENTTGQQVSYMAVRCAFYGKDGALLATALENWTGIGAGQIANGEISTDAVAVTEIDRYQCSATAQ